jgi:hypothetical protein
VAVHTINEHISAIYGDHELSQEATIRKFLIVQTEGSRQVERQVDFYNLDMILAIGYRVRSHRGVQFRRWATEHLKEYNWREKLDSIPAIQPAGNFAAQRAHLYGGCQTLSPGAISYIQSEENRS